MNVQISFRDVVHQAIAELAEDSPPSRVMATIADALEPRAWSDLTEDGTVDSDLRPEHAAMGRWAKRMAAQLLFFQECARTHAMKGEKNPPPGFRKDYETCLARLIDQLHA